MDADRRDRVTSRTHLVKNSQVIDRGFVIFGTIAKNVRHDALANAPGRTTDETRPRSTRGRSRSAALDENAHASPQTLVALDSQMFTR